MNPVNGGLFQLQPYTANNVLRVTSGNTALLTFANPAPCNVLHIADTGGNGAATYKFTLNFSDGTSTTVTGQTAPDWFYNSPFIDSDFGRVSQSGAYDNRATNPRLYENAFTLSAADSAKVLSSIAFTSTGGGILNVFAVTAGVSSQSYANNLNVTADSTLDVQGSTNAAFGNLAIGANALTVTGTSGATATLGAVTLSGNAIFTPAAGISLSLGPVGQDSNPRNLTKSGAGTLLLTGLSSYSGATAVNSGTVIVSGSLPATSGGTVSPGATLLLAGGSISGNLACSGTVGGTGAIAGALALTAGTLAPGSGPNHAGTLTAGDVQLDSPSTLSIALGGTGAGQFSVLAPNSIALASDGGSGATLTLSLTGGYTPRGGRSLSLCAECCGAGGPIQ